MRNREELIAGATIVGVPDHLIGGLVEYIVVGRPVGQFLTAVLENDLMGAMSRADVHSAMGLRAVCTFLYSYAPGGCFGSQESVIDWYKKKNKEAAGYRK